MFRHHRGLWCLATLLRMGMLDWLDNDHGRFYFHLIPCAVLFMAAGFGLERLRKPDDLPLFLSLRRRFHVGGAERGWQRTTSRTPAGSGSVAPWTRGQVEYLLSATPASNIYHTFFCRELGFAPSAHGRKA